MKLGKVIASVQTELQAHQTLGLWARLQRDESKFGKTDG